MSADYTTPGASTTPGDLGRRVAHRRKALGLSREELADRARIDPGYLEYVEACPARVADSTLQKLARALDTTPRELLGGSADRPPGEGHAGGTPLLEPLSEDECLRLIAPGGIGRVVFSGAAGPMVLPVNYRVHDRAVIFRTRFGGAMDQDLRTGLTGVEFKIAFQVDRIDEATCTGWSVLIHGPAHHITEEELAGVTGLGVEPWAGGERQLYIRIGIDSVTGRRIRTL